MSTFGKFWRIVGLHERRYHRGAKLTATEFRQNSKVRPFRKWWVGLKRIFCTDHRLTNPQPSQNTRRRHGQPRVTPRPPTGPRELPQTVTVQHRGTENAAGRSLPTRSPPEIQEAETDSTADAGETEVPGASMTSNASNSDSRSSLTDYTERDAAEARAGERLMFRKELGKHLFPFVQFITPAIREELASRYFQLPYLQFMEDITGGDTTRAEYYQRRWDNNLGCISDAIKHRRNTAVSAISSAYSSKYNHTMV